MFCNKASSFRTTRQKLLSKRGMFPASYCVIANVECALANRLRLFEKISTCLRDIAPAFVNTRRVLTRILLVTL